jgi:Fe-S-cluster-containing hydrogenase component 2
VERKAAIRSPECSGCLDCIQTCPVQGTLTLETTGLRHRGWSPAALALAILLVFTASIYTARITGHWQSQLSTGQFQHLLQRIDSPPMVHPSVGGTPSAPAGRPPGP